MPIALQESDTGVFRLEICGLLRKTELDAAQARLAVAIGRAGTIRVLIVLDGFQGWAAGENWGDLTFYVSHGDAIERLAIVGDERWRGEVLLFACADLRKGPVEFFPTGSETEAAAWLERNE